MKYKPHDKYELIKLVEDKNIYLGDIDTSDITDMSYLFCNFVTDFEYGDSYDCLIEPNRRTDFSGIEKWDVSNVESMQKMFLDCHNFNEPIGCWDVSKVKRMDYMFAGCCNFKQDLSNWNISKETDTTNMFERIEKMNSVSKFLEMCYVIFVIYVTVSICVWNYNVFEWGDLSRIVAVSLFWGYYFLKNVMKDRKKDIADYSFSRILFLFIYETLVWYLSICFCNLSFWLWEWGIISRSLFLIIFILVIMSYFFIEKEESKT